MTQLLKNVTAVLPDGMRRTGVLLVNDRIAAIGDNLTADTVTDAGGAYLMPGFIDQHVHGGGGADFMDGTPAAFETAAAAHLRHGTTTLLPTAMTATEAALTQFLGNYHACDKSRGARMPGVHLEGPYFSGADSKSRGAQQSDLLRTPDTAEIRRLLHAGDGDILRWDAAPELPGSDRFAALMRENGVLPAVAHTDATAAQCLAGFENGFAHITHFYCATSFVRKRGQQVLAGVNEAAYLTDSVTVELICDGRHVAPECIALCLKIKGAEKVSAITDATRFAGTALTSGKLGSCVSGTAVIVEDGVAKLPDRSSFAGSIATMDHCLRVLLRQGIPPQTAAVMLSLAPAKRLGLDADFGSIAVGKVADLVLLSPDWTVQTVFRGGEPQD